MNEPPIRLACVGDIMCGDSFYAAGVGVASSIDRFGPAFVPAETVDFLTGHDLVLANIEAPLSDHGRRDRALRSIHMRGRPTTAELLKEWGINIVTVANNHTFEHGIEAAVDSAANLRAAGIMTVASGEDGSFDNAVTVTRTEAGAVGLSFVGGCSLVETASYHGFTQWDDLVDAVAEERAAGRLAIVSMHWGHEFVDRPGAEQVSMATDLARAGASLIAGHHPHVAQGVTSIGSTLVAFSLGNFIFNGFVPDTQWSYVLSVEVTSAGVVSWSAHPVVQGPSFEPVLPTADEVDGGDGDEWRRLNRELGRRHKLAARSVSGSEDDRYHEDVVALTAQSRRQLRRKILANSARYPVEFLPQVWAKPVLKRIGRW